MTKSLDTPESQRQPTPSAAAPCSASDLIDALDMMRDEFQRIIACPGCNAEIEDIANRAQLKLVQHVPVIAQRDRAENEVSRLRDALKEIAYLQRVGPRWEYRDLYETSRDIANDALANHKNAG